MKNLNWLGKPLVVAGSVVAMFAFAGPVWADSGDDGSVGGRAPEASLVLLLPAAGGAALGIRLLLANRKRS